MNRFHVTIATMLALCGAGGFPMLFAEEPSRRIYVPIEDLDVAIDHDQRGVLLDKAEFEKLTALAKEEAEKRPKPPAVTIAWTKATYQARAVDDQLLLTVRGELRQFVPGWQQLVVPMTRTAVETARLDGEPALIGRGDGGALVLFTDGEGPHVLELSLSTELSALGADRAAAFGLLPAPSATFAINVPAGKHLQAGGWQLVRPAALDQPADYKLSVGGQESLHLKITDRGTDKSADVLAFATTGYGLHVMPGEVSWHALTTLQVFGKPLDRLTISAPNFLEIADIESSGLESWELVDDPNRPDHTQITLTYRQPFDGGRKIAFKGVMATPAEVPWTVPTLSIANVTSHVGQVVVQYPAGVRLQLMESQGVRRATLDQQAASDMPIDMGHLQAIEQLRFDFWQPEFTLRFLTQPRQRDVQTAVAAVLDVNSTGLDLDAAITVKTRFAPLFEVDLELPAEWTLLSVTRDGQLLPWQTVSQEAGKHLWRIPLSPALPLEGLTTLQLSIRREVEGWPVESEPLTVELPELILPQSNLHEGTLVIRGDDEFDLAALDVSGLDTVPLKAAFERLRFQSQDTRYAGQLKISRKPSRVAVESVSFTRLDPQTLHALLQAVVEVQGGGVRTLQIALPESTGPSLRFVAPRGPRIVEQTASDPANGRRTWTLQFDHRVRGRFLLFVDIEQPRGDLEKWTVPEWTFVDAERQNGYIAIEASGEQRLTIAARAADGSKLMEVDALDLPRTLYTPKERIIAVYRTVLAGATVTLEEQRFDKEPIPTAVCKLLSMTTVAGRDGELQHRGLFTLNLVGVQNLSLNLPGDAKPWSTLIDGKPVEVRQGKGAHLIPLPGPSTAGERRLEVFYKTQDADLDTTGTLEQAPPQLSVVTGTGTDQPVVVLQQDWKLYHPGETLLIDSDGWLEPTSPLDDTSWLGRWQDSLRRPTWQDLGQSLFYALIAVVLAALPILAMRRFGARPLMMFGAVVVCMAILISLMLPAVQNARRSAHVDMTAGTKSSDTIQQPITEYYAATEAAGLAAPAAPPMSAPAGAATPAAADFNMPQAPKAEMRDRIQGLRSEVMLDEAASDTPMADGEQSLARSRKPARSKSDLAKNPESKSKDGSSDGDPFAASSEKRPGDSKPNAGQPQRPQDDQGIQAGDEAGRKDAEKAGKSLSVDIRQRQTVANGVAAPNPDRAGRFGDEGQPAFAAGEQALLDGSGSMKTGGLLSLSLELTPPAGSRMKEFRYVGQGTRAQGTGDIGAPLLLTFAQRKSGTAFKLFLIAMFALAGWLNRRAPVSWKIAVTVLGLALPLGLVTIAPLGWQVLLDGVFFGTLAAAAVWIADALCQWLERHCPWGCVPEVVKLTGMVLAVAAMSATSSAQEAPAAPAVKPPASPVIVIPYETGTDPTASERILLPHDKFLELWRKAHPDKAVHAPAPIDGGLIEALYSAKLDVPADKPDDAVIRFSARYTIRSYVDGQWSAPVPLGAVALSAAKFDGKSAAISPKDGGYVAVIPAAGLHVLDLEFSVAAKLSGTTGQFTVPLKPVPAGKLTFHLPSKDLLVRVNGSSTVYRRVATEETTSVELPVDQAGDLTVAWQPPQAKGGGAAVVHVESVTAAAIRDAGVTLSVGLNYRVRQGTIQDVRFAFPASLKLQTVNGPDIGGWELKETPEGRELRILFRRAVNDQTQLGINLFLDQKVGNAPETFELPSFAPLEVTNEVGTVAIFAGDQFQVTASETSGLTQLDTATYAPVIPISNQKVPPRAAYRFAKRPFSASFQVGRQSSQGQLTAIHGVSVMRRKIQSTSRFQYQLTGAPRSVLSFALPKDFLPLEVKATALLDWYVDQRGDTPVLTVQLAQTRLGTVEAVITGSRPRDPNGPTAEIVLPQPLDITRLESTLALWTDESYLASIQSSDGWRSVDANAAGPELQHLRAKQSIRFAFQSSGLTTKPVTVQLARGEPRMRADGLVTTTVTEFTVVHALALQWQIDGSTVESLSLTTPKSLSGRLDFQGPEIREVVEADAGNDRVRWTIWFRTPVTGRYFATGLAALPPPAEQVAAPAILCEQPAASGPAAVIENQRQYVLLINGSASQLTRADADVVETVQRDDLPITVRQELIDQGTELVRLKTLGTAPVWTVQKFAQTESIPASVNVADLTTVIARDGTYRTQAVYTIKNRRRQFLALRLPAGAALLSVTLNNQPSRCVTATVAGQAAHLIALPKTSEADLSFPVKIVVAGRLAEPLPRKVRWRAQDIEIPAPQVVSQTEDDAFGIPVARTRWTVYLAEDLDVNPVSDPKRHNLTVTSEAMSELIFASITAQELNDLLDQVENATDPRQRGLAFFNAKIQCESNLKQLGLALRNYSDYSALPDITPQQAQEYAEQQRKVSARFSQVQKDFQANAGGQPASKEGKPTQQMLNFSNQSDVLNFANYGNSAIILDNRGAGIAVNEAADDTFQFDLQQPAVPQTETAAQPAPQQQSGIQTRGVYQRTNDANLEGLNTKISGKKVQQGLGSNLSSNISGFQFQSQTEFLPTESLLAIEGQVILGLKNTNPELAKLAEQFNGLYQQQRFDEAELLAKQAQQFAPNDPNATAMFWKARNARRSGASRNWQFENQEQSFLKQLNDMDESTIVAGDDWADFSGRGALGGRRHSLAPNLFGMEAPGPMVDGPGPGAMGGFGGGVDPNGRFNLGANAGGMGGGMGGGGLGANAGIADGTSNLGMWTQAGGLSLPIELPTAGQKFVYTKTGGEPKLTLSLRPKATLRFGLGFLWTAVWVVGALVLAAAVRGPHSGSVVTRLAAWGLCLLGLIGWCLLPAPMSALALIALVVGTFGVVWSMTRPVYDGK